MSLAKFIAHEIVKGTYKRFSQTHQRWIHQQKKEASNGNSN
jgi:hypothetical protein